MKAIDLIRFAMTMSNEGTLRLADELKDVYAARTSAFRCGHTLDRMLDPAKRGCASASADSGSSTVRR